MNGKERHEGPILPIVSAVTCVEVDEQDPFLIFLNQACYYADQEHDEKQYPRTVLRKLKETP